MHHTPLIATIVAGLVIAFIMGSIAHKLKVSPIAGYLLAGIMVGPFTPGFVADGNLAAELAEIGVILLMFGVGLHFSLRDLLAVRKIAVPGALGQIRSEEHTSELQSRRNLVCRLLLEKKKKKTEEV